MSRSNIYFEENSEVSFNENLTVTDTYVIYKF